ncbi:CPBP family intramembrane glutamic endopeptidase [Ferdinandcohnia quinoae]|uniref:CPBP family intramembrane metalloprotease n=1 Tax=Fredinandcohnia quinoae TaxID=2918902 RepID=A0AAW5E6L9_9BACI|nr:CPBP family intramembrane glutamic endopeptidase [Fredinandcohnia sp. SECRCQ15]MCH1624783.1 CPBP family intramembrane metalloprotease [Fredinandcohnia sp. SECRCQ15]
MGKRQADIIKELTDKQVLFHLYLTQIVVLIVSLIIGYLLFDNIDSFLNLWDLKDINIILVGGSTAVIVIMIDFMLMKYLPKSMYDDGGINERIFQNRGIAHIFGLCLLIALAEEILFRGVIQTHFGIMIASIIFALLHIRYLYKWVLLISVVLLSFLLGYIYEVTGNLAITVFAHFMIDFVFAVKIRMENR